MMCRCLKGRAPVPTLRAPLAELDVNCRDPCVDDRRMAQARLYRQMLRVSGRSLLLALHTFSANALLFGR